VGGWIVSDAVKTHVRRFAQAFTIPSRSMEPTLLVGDYVMADKAILPRPKSRRGDIVVYRYPEDERRTFVGRIMAVPAETIQVRGGDVLINGRPLEEPYVKRSLGASYDSCTYAYGCQPHRDPGRPVFRDGRPRDNARDSRYFGFVAGEGDHRARVHDLLVLGLRHPLAAARARGQVAVR